MLLKIARAGRRMLRPLLLLTALYLLVVLVPYVKDWEKLKTTLAQEVKGATGLDLAVGTLRYKPFPLPRIEANNITLTETRAETKEPVLTVARLKGSLSVTSLILGRAHIHRLTLRDPALTIEISGESASRWIGLMAKLWQGTSALESFATLDHIVIRNGTFHYRLPSKNFIKTISGVTNHVYLERDAEHGLPGFNLYSEESATNFAIALQKTGNDAAQLHVELSTPGYGNLDRFDIKGNITNLNKAFLFVGGFSSSIGNPAQFLARQFYASQAPVVRSRKALTEGEKTNIKGNISFSSQFLMLNNASFESDYARGVFIYTDKVNPPDKGSPVRNTELSATVDYLNLDYFITPEHLFGVESIKTGNNLMNSVNTLLAEQMRDIVFFLPEAMSGSITLTVGEIIFREAPIKNVRLAAVFEQGAVSLKSLTASLPGESSLQITGVFPHLPGEGANPFFDGVIEFKGSNLKEVVDWLEIKPEKITFDTIREYAMRGAVTLYPRKSIFTGVSIRMNDTVFSGGMVIDEGRKTLTNIILQAERLHIDEFLVPTVQSLIGMENILKIDSIQWLSDVDQLVGDVRATMDVGELILGRKSYQALAADLEISQHYLNVPRYNVLGNQGEIRGRLSLNTINARPLIDAAIEMRSLDTGAIHLPQKTVQPAPPLIPSPVPSLPTQLAIWVGFLELVDGSLQLSIDTLLHDGWQFDKAKATFELKDKVLKMTNFESDFLGGRLELKANVAIAEQPVMVISVFGVNLDAQAFLKKTMQIDTISGRFNTSATLTVVGITAEEMIRRSQGRILANAVNLTVAGIDLQRVVDTFIKIKSRQDIPPWMASNLSAGATTFDYIMVDGTLNAGLVNFPNIQWMHKAAANAFSKGTLDWLRKAVSFETTFPIRMPNLTYLPLSVAHSGRLGAIKTQWNQTMLEGYWNGLYRR